MTKINHATVRDAPAEEEIGHKVCFDDHVERISSSLDAPPQIMLINTDR